MNIKHQKLSAIAAAIVLASSTANAEIELGKGFSVSGFVDMSFQYIDKDGTASTEKVFAVDQVETNFMYKGSDGVSAQVDIEYGENGGVTSGSTTGGAPGSDDETFVEQAFITKTFNDHFSTTAGRFLSYTGWETEEPTGLFQYSSTGYGSTFYGGYQQGVSGKFTANDAVAVTLSVVNDLGSPTVSDTTQLGTELGVHLTPVEGLTTKLFYSTEGDTDLINFWTSFATGGLTLALEYNDAETAGTESDGYLLMGNYSFGAFGVTLRYHAYETETKAGATTIDADAITLAPSMTIGDNLLLVAEYRMDTEDVSDVDTDTFALEALFTF